MRRYLAALLLTAAAAAGAHETDTTRSQARAKALIDAAVTAIGGEAALRGLANVRRDYTEDWVDVGQGPRPWTGSPPADALRPHAYSAASETMSFIDYANGRFYLWARFVDSPTDFGVFVDAVTPEKAFQAFTYVREMPILTERSSRAPYTFCTRPGEIMNDGP